MMVEPSKPVDPDPAARDPRPIVRMPRQGIPGVGIAGVAVVLAVILFVTLDGRRRETAVVSTATGQSDGFAPPPPLALPPEVTTPPVVYARPPLPMALVAPGRPAVTPAYTPPRAYEPPPAFVETAPPPSPPATAAAEISTPRTDNAAMVFDLGVPPSDGTGTPSAGAPQMGSRTDGGGSDDMPAQASTMRSRTDTVPIGTLIPIVLETPIDTARPGLVRAVASRDARGFDGRRVLIPRGSRFIGEYKADIRSGQDRVLVNWTRVIRPDGVTIRLGSPAADQLGGAGVPGRVNSFFLQRFANAILQSALTVGVNLASRPRSGSIIVGIPTGQIANVGQSLIPNDYQPKITVKQGAQLNVFVARDLDFSSLSAGQP